MNFFLPFVATVFFIFIGLLFICIATKDDVVHDRAKYTGYKPFVKPSTFEHLSIRDASKQQSKTIIIVASNNFSLTHNQSDDLIYPRGIQHNGCHWKLNSTNKQEYIESQQPQLKNINCGNNSTNVDEVIINISPCVPPDLHNINHIMNQINNIPSNYIACEFQSNTMNGEIWFIEQYQDETTTSSSTAAPSLPSLYQVYQVKLTNKNI